MATYESTTRTNMTEVAAAVEAGRKSASLDERYDVLDDLPPGETARLADSIPIFLNDKGTVEVAESVLAAFRGLAPGPRRREGQPRLHELASFIAYLLRHRHEKETVVFADQEEFSVQAIFDYHPIGDDNSAARWAKHRAVYTCPRSPEWEAWTEKDGQAMGQEAFADFVESRLEDITSSSTHKDFPSPVELLEMARNLTIRTAGTFQKQIDPTTGTGSLICKTEHGAESTKIPRAFLLGLRVFEGGERYQVEARLRFQLAEGRARFQFDLHRRTEIERDAFGDVTKQIAATGVPVFAGAP